MGDDELRLPSAPVKDIIHRTGLRVTPDGVDTARALAEEAIEIAARKAADELEDEGLATIDGEYFATWWPA